MMEPLLCAHCIAALFNDASVVRFYPPKGTNWKDFLYRGAEAIPQFVSWFEAAMVEYGGSFAEGAYPLSINTVPIYSPYVVSFVDGTALCSAHLPSALYDGQAHRAAWRRPGWTAPDPR
jgi:hypothetical protein